MSEFAPKNLANGQLPNSKTTLYTTPTGKAAIMRSIVLVNTGASAVTVNLYVNFGTGSRRIIPKNLSLQPNAANYVQDLVLALEAGDLVEGDASSATTVDFVIGGVESV